MKRFMKRLIWILPVAWIWAAFYIGDIILTSNTDWYTFPYIVTAFILLAILFLFSDKIFPLR